MSGTRIGPAARVATRAGGAGMVDLPRRVLAAIGGFTRLRLGFLLMVAAASWGVVYEAARPGSWRRTIRDEFRAVLRQAAGGGLPSTLFTAALAGIGMVSQAAYWLGVAGLSDLTGSLLVTVLLREIDPILVGVILLGRSGLLAVAELGMLQTGGQVRTLIAEGIDPFALLVLPRVIAFGIASFTLGIAFALFALVAGFLFSTSLGNSYGSLWSFLAAVVGAVGARDFVLIPVKLVAIGFGVGICSCLSGLVATQDDDVARLLPRGFARGMLTLMAIDIGFMVFDA